MTNTYAINCNGSDLIVNRVPSCELADNGEEADARQTIRLHVCTGGDVWVVLTTNGDDNAIGWLDGGVVEFNDNVDDNWFASFGYGCTREWVSELVADAINGV